MRLQWLGPGLFVLALGVAFPRSARAQAEVSSTAVLGLEAIDVPAAVADDIAEQLRQRVAASKDLRLVSGKDLVELKLVFSCADESASCMAQAGKSLDAQRLIYGSIKRVGDDYAVWLKMFDVRKAKIEFWLTENVPKKADSQFIKASSSRWFAKLTGRPLTTGAVHVTSNPVGARLFLDSNPVGVTSEQPLTLPDVAPGKHELTAIKAGYKSANQQISVAAGHTISVNLILPVGGAVSLTPPAEVRSASGPLPPTEADKTAVGSAASASDAGAGTARSTYRTGFWVTLAAGLASAGAAVKFGLDVRSANQALDPYRRFPCTTSASGYCDGDGNAAGSRDLTMRENEIVATKTDEGSRAQTLQWICVGVGSALGIASGYLFYKGYLDTDDDQGRKEARRGLRVFPTAGVSSGGVLAEFDF